MAGTSNKAVLKKIMSKYKHKDVALKDVVAVIEIFPNLIPSQDTYNFNDGSCKDLLKLSGTIPVTYRGCVYNIPVEIWLLDSHPAHPPLCFVRPTASMMIRPSCRVDSNGRVYLPYLSEWGAVCACVRERVQASDVLGLIQVMCAEFGEEPPVLSLGRGVTQSAAYRASSVGPSAGSAVVSPVSYPACQPSVASPTLTAVYMNQPPQLPPRSASPHVAPADSMSLLSRSGTVTHEHLHASLVSAIVDQLRRREQEAQGRAQAELAALKRTHSELSSGRDRLGFLLNALANEMAQVDTWLEAVRVGVEPAHGRPPQAGDGGVDGGVRTPTPLHGQIVELHAQDGAIEDTAFQLGEAIRCNVVELDAFLKHVRLLARRQFLVRALMLKARRAAGLTEVC